MRKIRVIIVDDDHDLREMLRTRLELEGYEVQVAGNGLRLLSRLKLDRPDLILLDVMMSWLNGLELCQALKKNPEFAEIPVFLISALGSKEDIQRGHDSGCTRYFVKPLDMKELMNEIREQAAVAPAPP